VSSRRPSGIPLSAMGMKMPIGLRPLVVSREATRPWMGWAWLVLLVGCGSSSSTDDTDGAIAGDSSAVSDASGTTVSDGAPPDGGYVVTGANDSGGSDANVSSGDGGIDAGDSSPMADGNAPADDSGAVEEGGPDGASTSVDGAAIDGGASADGSTEGGEDASSACSGGTSYLASDATGSRAQVTGYGFIDFVTSAKNPIVALDTTLTVPAKPPASGTLFLWPGLQPDGPGSMDLPINNGVLQPVLTWGPTCAPNAPNGDAYGSWWISAQYVNTYIAMTSPDYADYGGCHGGPGMDVGVGDSLNLSMTLNGTSWIQTVTDAQNGQSVTYTIDMMGQEQDIAEFDIEEYSQMPLSDVVFTSTTLTFASSQPSACQPETRGTNDYFSAPEASSDGLHCCIQKLILRAQGVAATSPDSP
jgi:hypothetical protein